MKGRIPVALAATALLAAASPAHAQFSLEGTYATGEGPYQAYAADFNADGRPDIAVSNGDNSTSISLFLRQPGGGFAPEAGSPFPIASNSNGALGDYNGDGFPDLVIADYGFNGITVALRNPAGGFTIEPAQSFGGLLTAVGAGDFNRDGRTDIAVANESSANVSVLFRNASNTGFSLDANYGVGAARQIAVADFDLNGAPDIALTNLLAGTVTVMVNNGSGGFSAEPPFNVGAGPNGIVAGDFDGDGRPDLAVANGSSGTVSILRRTPIGGWVPLPGSPVTVGAGPATVAAGDFDGSGTLDIAVTTNASLDVVRLGPAGYALSTSTPIASTGSGLAVADFNGDGRPDAAATSLGANLLSTFLSPGPPPTQPPPPQPTPTPTPPLDNPRVNAEVNVLPVSGRVLVRRRGSNRFEELKAGQQIPNGSTVDARDGRVTIVAAQSATKLERADFYDGIFRVSQTRRLTTVTLTEALDCRRGRASAAQRKPKSRKLWGDGKGKFRTKGRYSAATIRGTRWLVTDTCTTTRTRVTQGSVNVRDTVRGRTVIVRKGKSYTARARR